jgi:hypothetical protein
LRVGHGSFHSGGEYTVSMARRWSRARSRDSPKGGVLSRGWLVEASSTGESVPTVRGTVRRAHVLPLT